MSIVTLLAALSACSGGVSSEEHITRANQFIVNSEYDAAIIELKNALQADNNSGEARWLLGKTYLESGDVLSAEKELQRAFKLGWSHNDVVPALAESLLAQGKSEDPTNAKISQSEKKLARIQKNVNKKLGKTVAKKSSSGPKLAKKPQPKSRSSKKRPGRPGLTHCCRPLSVSVNASRWQHSRGTTGHPARSSISMP